MPISVRNAAVYQSFAAEITHVGISALVVLKATTQ